MQIDQQHFDYSTLDQLHRKEVKNLQEQGINGKQDKKNRNLSKIFTLSFCQIYLHDVMLLCWDDRNDMYYPKYFSEGFTVKYDSCSAKFTHRKGFRTLAHEKSSTSISFLRTTGSLIA